MPTTPGQQEKTAFVSRTNRFFRVLGLFEPIPDATDRPGFYTALLRTLLKAGTIERGRVSCSFVVTSAFANPYNTLHGGVVAGVAEAVAIACAKTVAGEKELFPGESTTSYLSAASLDDEVEVDGCILRQGRNVIVTSVEFRIKKSQRLFYISRSTLYIMPVANL